MTTQTKPEILTPEEREQTVERLKAARSEADAEDRQRGEQNGRDWAMFNAEPAALARLDTIEKSDSGLLAVEQAVDIGSSPAWVLWRMLYPRDQDGFEDWLDAAFGVTDSELLGDKEVRGFIDGALAVWRDVRSDV